MTGQLVERLIAKLDGAETDPGIELRLNWMHLAHGKDCLAVALLIKCYRCAEHARVILLIGHVVDLDQAGTPVVDTALQRRSKSDPLRNKIQIHPQLALSAVGGAIWIQWRPPGQSVIAGRTCASSNRRYDQAHAEKYANATQWQALSSVQL